MVRLLHQSLEAGGLGLSTTRSSTHTDGDGNPVPSRAASEEELLTLCRTSVSQHPGTTLEAIVEGCLRGFTDDEIELLAQMSAQANRPLNWNVLVGAGLGRRARSSTSCCPRSGPARSAGGCVALTMPIFADNNMSLGTFCALWLIPGWRDVLSLSRWPRRRTSCGTRRCGQGWWPQAKGTVFERLADFSNYRIGDTVAPREQAVRGAAGHRHRPGAGHRPGRVR